MKKFLLIDTSTERGIIAMGCRERVLFTRELPCGLTQSKFLLPYLEEALHSFEHPLSLDAIAVGTGPGSYTGIRVGVAVAQTLAYSWKVPLVGFSGLRGFVPEQNFAVPFAALLDARIGGVYVQKGMRDRGVLFHGEPYACAWNELGESLKDVGHLITPHAASLEIKMKEHYPAHQWNWVERTPCMHTLLQQAEEKFSQGNKVIPPSHLEIHYLYTSEFKNWHLGCTKAPAVKRSQVP